MKKIFILFSVFFIAKNINAQDGEQSLLLGRAEYGLKDKLNIFLTGTTMSWAGDIRFSSERHLSELYLGKVISKWNDDKIRLALTPGIAFADNKGQLLYGCKILHKTAEIGGVETLLNGGFLRSLNKDPRVIFFFDGELIRSFKSFKLGVGLGAEQQKEKTGEGIEQRMIYDDHFHMEVRFVWKFSEKSPFSLSGFAGMLYQNHAAKTPIYIYDLGHETRLNIGLGVRYEIF